MIEELREAILNWEMESGNARKMEPDVLEKFNKYLATELSELYHNSRCIFMIDKQEAETVMKRAMLAGDQLKVLGSITLEDYNQHIYMISFQDHQYLGSLLRREEDVQTTNNDIEPPIID
jgi:hypothetical protein